MAEGSIPAMPVPSGVRAAPAPRRSSPHEWPLPGDLGPSAAGVEVGPSEEVLLDELLQNKRTRRNDGGDG